MAETNSSSGGDLDWGGMIDEGLSILTDIFSMFNNSATDLETSKMKSAGDIQYLETVMQALEENNAERVVNELERFSAYVESTLSKRMSRRSWHENTEEGWSWELAEMRTYRSQVLAPFVNNLKSKAQSVTYKSITVQEQELEDIYRPAVPSENTTAEKNGTVTYKEYTIVGEIPVEITPEGVVSITPVGGTNNLMFAGVGLFAILWAMGFLKLGNIKNKLS